ncbi:OmpA family protein [candidate division FCPU426 bacterium]|nr:OmpA family protein [candidate division FCPU426 bacterium]
MREMIAIVICVVIFMIALQSGMVKTGLEYDILQKNNESLQATNDRLTEEIKRMNNLQQDGDTVSTDHLAMLERLEKAKADLKKQLAREIKRREIVLEESGEWLKLVLLDKALFAKQADGFHGKAGNLLSKIAEVFNHFEEMEIRITVYTDNQPLHGKAARQFRSLRHLATARAIAIEDYFKTQGRIDPVQILTAGFGDARPLVPNDSEYHRTLNGRVEISLYPVPVEILAKSREIYRTEALIPDRTEKTRRPAPKEEYEPEFAPGAGQPIGEDALDQVDDSEFNTGYEVPNAQE